MQPEGSVPVHHGPAEDEVLRHGGADAERDGGAAAGGRAVAAAAGAKGHLSLAV